MTDPGSDLPPSLPVAPDESDVWSGRPRLSSAAPAFAIGAALGAVAAFVVGASGTAELVSATLLAAGVGGAVVAAWPLLVLANTRYVVTDRAAYVKRGVVGRSVSRARLSMVQDSAYAQPVLGSVFGYGTVELRTAGGGFDFRRIDDPAAVRALVDRARGGAAGGGPGSIEQWRAVRAEVRALRRAVER